MSLDKIRGLLESNNICDTNEFDYRIGEEIGIVSGSPNQIAKNLIGGLMRIDDFRLLLINQGSVNVDLNLVNHSRSAGTLAFAHPGSIIQIRKISDDVNITAIAVSETLFRLSLNNDIPASFNGHLRDFIISPNHDQINIIRNIISAIKLITDTKIVPRAIYSLLASLYSYVNGIYVDLNTDSQKNEHRRQSIVNQFIQLVNTHCAEHHNVGFYADMLCLSSRYLSTIIHKESGKTAKEWIDRALIDSAKVLLRHSDLQVVQIAYDLNFPNPAFFGKFFRRLTGTTPAQYRKSSSL